MERERTEESWQFDSAKCRGIPEKLPDCKELLPPIVWLYAPDNVRGRRSGLWHFGIRWVSGGLPIGFPLVAVGQAAQAGHAVGAANAPAGGVGIHAVADQVLQAPSTCSLPMLRPSFKHSA